MKDFKNGFNSNIVKWVIITFVIVVLYTIMDFGHTTKRKLIFSDFMSQVSEGNIKEVSIRGNIIEGKFQDGSTFTTLAPKIYEKLIENLQSNKVQISVLPIDSTLGNIIGILLSWFPIILLVGVWIYFLRGMQGGGRGALGFGKSKAKLMEDKGKKVVFDDVAGVDEAKEDLQEVVEFLKDPSKFSKLGGKIPKGCLLIGSPGTGKTLLARAIAGESGVPFFSISGSDFVEMFVGVGASRVRDMFAQAKKHAPCILFIDEIDAVGRHRGAGLGGGNDEREQTLNQLLVEMDGFAENQGIIVIAATNRPDVLDPALLRPGRFDRQITVPIPDIQGRCKILAVHLKNIPTAQDIKIDVIAKGTPGFSGADLANLVNESALRAARSSRNMVTMEEIEYAKDKVLMGSERKSMAMSEEHKKLTAYHEGGHAIVTINLPAADPIHKATIIPRGRALGMVMQLPEDDGYSISNEQLDAKLKILMGGRVAEELIFGKKKITTGASSDIKSATEIARNMVEKWGLSEKLGPIMIGNDRENVFLGYSMGGGKDNHISDQLAEKVDNEVKTLLTNAYSAAKKILTDHIDDLHTLANALIKYETLSGDDIKELLSGKELKKKDFTQKEISSSVPNTRTNK